jgi:hypothetical protein
MPQEAIFRKGDFAGIGKGMGIGLDQSRFAVPARSANKGGTGDGERSLASASGWYGGGRDCRCCNP